EGLGGAHSARGGVEQLDRLGGGLTTADVPVIEPLAQGGSMHAGYVRLQFSGAVQFTEEGGDSAGTVHVLHMEVRVVGGHLGQARHVPADRVDIGQGEVHLGLLGRGQDVQHGVGGSAHRHFECHRVGERVLGGDAPGGSGVVFVLVVPAREVDDGAPGVEEELLAGGVGGQCGPVAGQGEPEGFGQAVHRVGREHARTGAAGGARAGLDLAEGLVADVLVGGVVDRVDQVQVGLGHA